MFYPICFSHQLQEVDIIIRQIQNWDLVSLRDPVKVAVLSCKVGMNEWLCFPISLGQKERKKIIHLLCLNTNTYISDIDFMGDNIIFSGMYNSDL